MTGGGPADAHAAEVGAGQRFRFGANWARFLRHLDEDRILASEASLQTMLARESLTGLRFLDAGAGSGLFSLAARRLGADVHSFDYDPESVACTAELRRRLKEADLAAFGDDAGWRVERGSVLDTGYLAQLGQFDVVYSWGVLHHTGDLQGALANVAGLVAPGGQLFIAIYNDQGIASRWWTLVKRAYNRCAVARVALIAAYTPYFIGLRWAYRRLTGTGPLGRGMMLWHDMLDWLGGYPFEVARPEQVLRFYRLRGFELREMTTAGGTGGCNEFVFERPRDAAASGQARTQSGSATRKL